MEVDDLEAYWLPREPWFCEGVEVEGGRKGWNVFSSERIDRDRLSDHYKKNNTFGGEFQQVCYTYTPTSPVGVHGGQHQTHDDYISGLIIVSWILALPSLLEIVNAAGDPTKAPEDTARELCAVYDRVKSGEYLRAGPATGE